MAKRKYVSARVSNKIYKKSSKIKGSNLARRYYRGGERIV